MNIIELLEEYLLEIKSTCKKSTFDRYEVIIRKYIKPFFGVCDLLPLEVKRINAWKLWLLNYKLADSTNRKIYITFSCALNYAYRVYNIENSFHRCRNFKNRNYKKKFSIYTIEEFKKYISVVDNLECKAFFTLLFFSGVRRGEALALQWKDLQGNKINIYKSSRKKVIGSTKTEWSNRVVILPGYVVELLQELKQVKKYSENNFMFNYSESSFTRFNKIYSFKASLPTIRIHDFRHSHITYLFYLGFSPMVISERVGHKDTEQLFKTYAHLYKSEEINLFNILCKEIDTKIK